jgi:hypothetical protein
MELKGRARAPSVSGRTRSTSLTGLANAKTRPDLEMFKSSLEKKRGFYSEFIAKVPSLSTFEEFILKENM